MSNEELLLRRLADAGGCLCAEALDQRERAAAERMLEMGFVRYDLAIALTERGRAMVENLQVN